MKLRFVKQFRVSSEVSKGEAFENNIEMEKPASASKTQ